MYGNEDKKEQCPVKTITARCWKVIFRCG